MSKEIENLLNKGKIDIEHLRILKAKQSFEAMFIVMVVFSVVITIGDIAFNKNKEKIEEISTNAQKVLIHEDAGFDSSITMTSMKAIDIAINGETKNKKVKKVQRNGNIKVTVKSGDTIYTLFKENGIAYSKKNLAKAKKLNNKRNLRVLKIGDEIILPAGE